MTKIAPAALLFAGTIPLAPIHAALAISAEDAPTDADGSAQIADPDEAIDNFANPGSDTGGSATIEMPPIDVPTIMMPDDG